MRLPFDRRFFKNLSISSPLQDLSLLEHECECFFHLFSTGTLASLLANDPVRMFVSRIIQYSKCVKYTKSISKWSFVGTKIVGYNCGNGYGYACFTDYVSALHPNRSVSRDQERDTIILSILLYLERKVLQTVFLFFQNKKNIYCYIF